MLLSVVFMAAFFTGGFAQEADAPVFLDTTGNELVLEEVKKPVDFNLYCGLIQNFNRPGFNLPAISLTTFVERWGFTYQYDLFLGEHSAGINYQLIRAKSNKPKFYILKE